MRIDDFSLAFNCSGCPSWGTAIVIQDNDKTHLIKSSIASNIIIGMMRKCVTMNTHDFSLPIGKGSKIYYGDTGFDGAPSEPMLVSVFNKVYINGVKIDAPYIMCIIRDRAKDHEGRLQLKYTPKLKYGEISNMDFFNKAIEILNIQENTPWTIYDIDVIEQEKLYFKAIIGVDEKDLKEQLNKIPKTSITFDLAQNPLEKQQSPQIEPSKRKKSDALQQIYYGAPGTGKSHIINESVCGESVIRTTFHPDSDYSTFVGCYKPTMKSGVGEVLSVMDLKKKLFDLKLKGDAYPCQRFGAQYWNSLINLSAKDIKDILTDCGFTENFSVEIGKGIAVGKDMSSNAEDRIVYEFVEQAFLQAYIKAWKFYDEANEEIKSQYLVIEEINRGNCAQIFGDLFQLLDRNSYGFSDYPIQADNDMRKQLSKALASINISEENKARINACYKGGKDYVKQVLSGEILLLPDNFYIWATMNTSDQSLFPIDSAFKRRWDWQYMPIAKGRENGEELNWCIQADTKEYDWWSFLTKINEQIGSTTNSEDKKLGFFFCKAKDGVISAETFVGKVVFYLWNDVFKDFGFESTIFNDEDGSTLSFDKFYSKENIGKVVKSKVQKFLDNLEVEVVGENPNPEDDFGKIIIDGTEIKEGSPTETFIKALQLVGLEKLLDKPFDNCILVTKDKPEKAKSRLVDGYYINTGLWPFYKKRWLKAMAAELGIELTIE